MEKNNFLKKGIISMFDQFFFSFSSFITGVLLARASGPEASGIYALILSVIMIAIGLQRATIALPFNVHFPKMSDNVIKKKYQQATCGLECFFLVVSTSVLVLLKMIGLWNVPVNSYVLVLFIIGYLIKDFMRQFFYALDRINKCILFGIMQSGLQIFLLAVLYFLKLMTLNNMIFIIGITNIFCSVIFGIKYFYFCFSLKSMKKTFINNWFTAKWSIGISLSDAIKNQISIWILYFFLSTSIVGIYNVNSSFALLPAPVFNGLSQYLLPEVSKLISKNEYKTVNKSFIISIILILSCNLLWIIVVVFTGNALISLLYGKEYVIGLPILILFCIRGVFTSLSGIVSSILQAIEKPQAIVKSLVFSILFMIVFGNILTWQFDLLGMSVAMSIMYILNTVTQLIYVKRWMKERRPC